jgi:hypothetical protein
MWLESDAGPGMDCQNCLWYDSLCYVIERRATERQSFHFFIFSRTDTDDESHRTRPTECFFLPSLLSSISLSLSPPPPLCK